MKHCYINNGTAYPVSVGRAVVGRDGFTELPVTILAGGKSDPLHNVGSLHWVLPSTVHESATVKQRKTCVEISRGSLLRTAYVSKLTANPLKES